MTVEPWRWSATQMAAAIRVKELSSLECVESCIGRIEAINPAVNAVVDLLYDEARSAAKTADAALARGEAIGPLHGVPVTVKINIDYGGRPTTNGAAQFKGRIPAADAPVVERWRNAGAIIVGRTNTPAMSFGLFTNNKLYGRTWNPWDHKVSPGGSSGGAAVSVATGMVPLAHGNDSGGSIRYPAYCCGVFGMRPTFGRVPHFSSTAATEMAIMSQLAICNGPFARTIDDLRIALNAMSGHDPRDPWSSFAPIPEKTDIAPGKVAVLTDLPGVEKDQEVVAAVRQAAAWLADAGYEIEECAPPHYAEASALRDRLLIHELRIHNLPMIEASAPLEEINEAYALLNATPTVDFEDFRTGLARRTTILREWLAFMQTYPIVLTPTAWRKPQAIDTYDNPVSLTAEQVLELSPLHVAPLLGLPTLAAPTGLVGGVPMGVQLMGSLFQEEQLFAAGAVLEARCSSLTPVNPVPVR
ncbi:amidase [Ochrobactrum sp. 19YEA23]|uniref:amidase n=1 Tax=Ochrobactrum sp. 19YEA23 TaxID=3039854 RepID=UPI0024790370|nr:amidase [Ochrobactrum sp. 19YEA23]